MSSSPAIDMLWESADPHRELTERFGFPNGASAADWIAEILEHHWKLAVRGCDRLVISDRNVIAWVRAGDRSLVAKWSSSPHRFPHLEDAARLVTWLDTQAVPVAAPVEAVDGRLLIEVRRDSNARMHSQKPMPDRRFLLGVFPVVAGHLLDTDDPQQVKEAGQMLATIHDALARYPGRIGRGDEPANGQIIHGDYRSANIIHSGTRIAAVLDFEEIRLDTRVTDLAKSAVLLATRYRDWGPTDERVRDAYIEAYDQHARVSLADSERNELDLQIDGLLTAFGWT